MVTGYGALDAKSINLEEKVKVVFNYNNEAIYFSGVAIPHNSNKYYNHIGLYCFPRNSLKIFKIEKLAI